MVPPWEIPSICEKVLFGPPSRSDPKIDHRVTRSTLARSHRRFKVKSRIFRIFQKTSRISLGSPRERCGVIFCIFSNSSGPRRPADHRYNALYVDFELRFSRNPGGSDEKSKTFQNHSEIAQGPACSVPERFWKVFDFFLKNAWISRKTHFKIHVQGVSPVICRSTRTTGVRKLQKNDPKTFPGASQTDLG